MTTSFKLLPYLLTFGAQLLNLVLVKYTHNFAMFPSIFSTIHKSYADYLTSGDVILANRSIFATKHSHLPAI